VGTRAGLDRCGKSRPSPGFDPWTVQLVASRYTDYATRPTDLLGAFPVLLVRPEQIRLLKILCSFLFSLLIARSRKHNFVNPNKAVY